MEDTRFLGVRGWLVGALIGSVLCLGSATSVQAWYEGRIVDAETKEPIVGVVVFMKWSQSHLDQGHTFVDAAETLTDEQGRFSLPRYWTWNLWKLGMTNHQIIIFKSGYEPIFVATWRGFKAREKGKPKDPNVWKVERGQPVIWLRKVALETGEDYRKQRERMGFVGPGGAVPPEKSVLLRREMDKEHEILYPK